MSIEGAIHIHNFLVDYRNEQSKTNESTVESEEESDTECIIFEKYFCDSGIQSIVVGNDMGKPSGRSSVVDR